jgi:hypothetical protein
MLIQPHKTSVFIAPNFDEDKFKMILPQTSLRWEER